MPWKIGAMGVLLALGLVACTSDDRQWMKLDQKYTIEDFRRDSSTCTVKGKLDDACMRAKGWIDVGPAKGEKPPDPYGRDTRPARQRPITNQ
jgi:hypothetical protein